MRLFYKVSTLILTSVCLFLTAKTVVSAYSIPNFPACSNPNGTLMVSYNDGTHGIVGSTAVYQGSDKVYSLENGNALQCFCASDNSGIQTNWWKVSSLDQEEIQTLKNLGWYFIPDGSVWGLQPGMYMAQNTSYSCAAGSSITTSSSGGNGGPVGAPQCNAEVPAPPTITSVKRNGTEVTLTWTKIDKATHYTISYGTDPNNLQYGVFNTGNVTSFTIGSLDPNATYYYKVYAVNDCMPSNGGGGSPIGGGQVLGLSNTGDNTVLTFLTVLGFGSLLLGIKLRRSGKSN